ncbi:MAG: adenosine deaminase [Hyphomonadaceae bacterium]|nr:MAG: adenosine deaminase [Hyphomonadaceae bacterium]KAF0185947.1 MAG: adenosine deaminase [Hyphomonadaceae bacterium]
MQNIEKFIKGLPKAELHLHLEGSLEPEMMFELAARNNIKIPFKTPDEVRAAYKFSNLQEFLDIYYQGASVLVTEQDFYDLTFAYLTRMKADNCKHIEVFFDPQTHTDRGIGFDVVVGGISRALADGKAKYGITSRLIMCFLRHLPEDAAFKTLEQAKPYLDKIIGVGLDSGEVGHPPSKFARVFAAARELGLKIVAHAGEEGPPEYIYEALDLLHVDRIDHGNRCMEDNALVARIASAGLTLTVCPLSNLALCVVKDLKKHPLREMMAAGLKVTINSDDPAYFGGYLNQNYIETAQALDLSRDEIITCAKNSFLGSFLPDDEIAKHLSDIEVYCFS